MKLLACIKMNIDEIILSHSDCNYLNLLNLTWYYFDLYYTLPQ